ncbi:uncharacterized protein EV422DRAFT_520577 [Fimicolochytrium jonesii]|uniref:uncharacterized protein n=1 Tax=Fimicolochytrium jonesii TaxID=1396493 RepID=UPI0022FE7CA5|nr:uncharacterized protein EV422DRAFT_520577 [Fimicolochytrium jonesii]KAI8824573.1 hypothetical protein EV422DRAFT_520577 [Fimicolochytrium jonesii]
MGVEGPPAVYITVKWNAPTATSKALPNFHPATSKSSPPSFMLSLFCNPKQQRPTMSAAPQTVVPKDLKSDLASLDKLFAYVDANKDFYVQRLAEVVAIPSVSGEAARRKDVVRMGEWLVAELKTLGATVSTHIPGTQELEGQTLDLPPIVLGQYGADPKKKTVLVYGHYDVQPAFKEDGWKTDPWTLVEAADGRLYGRGSTDDKAPILGWLWVIEAHKKLGVEFPVNLKMCFEGMEESGSEGLDEFIYKEAKGEFFGDVDCVCISDNYWLGTTKPCITYGLRGISYYMLEISGPGKDLHSGVFGGTVHEPMTDLAIIFSKLVSPNGKILIPGIYDSVVAVTADEDKLYDSLDFTLNDLHEAMDSKVTIHNKEKDALMARWRFPSLSLHGIEGAFHSSGSKTVIPAKVVGKFSIRSVPNMEPEEINRLVKKFVDEEFAKLGSKNTIKLDCSHGGKCWVADTNHYNYVAAEKATERIWKVKPDYTREGGSIPVTLTFQEALNRSVLLLPMGTAADGAHSIDESIPTKNYVEGIKLLGTYLHEIAAATATTTA